MTPAQSLPAKTLVVAPNWVGDNVMAIPVLEALAATGRTLTVLARPHLEPLLRIAPSVAGVLARSLSDRATVSAVRDLAFEEAVILPNSFRSAWIAFRAGIPVRWGYRGDFRSLLLEPALPRPKGIRHQLTDYDALLERIGAAIPSKQPRLVPDSRQLDCARDALERLGMRSDAASKMVGIFPGAEFGPSKRWPPERFAGLLSSIVDRSEFRPVLIAGPGEEDLATHIRNLSKTAAPIIGPELDLAELAAVLSHLDVLVTNDSGPMHVAAATGTRCVALFGPTNPTRTAPAGSGHRVLYNHRWCSPCFKKRCPLLHQRCLRDLSVSRVVDELLAALA